MQQPALKSCAEKPAEFIRHHHGTNSPRQPSVLTFWSSTLQDLSFAGFIDCFIACFIACCIACCIACFIACCIVCCVACCIAFLLLVVLLVLLIFYCFIY